MMESYKMPFKRSYMCQRCLNHGKQVKRKNHKFECVFKDCRCVDCEMVTGGDASSTANCSNWRRTLRKRAKRRRANPRPPKQSAYPTASGARSTTSSTNSETTKGTAPSRIASAKNVVLDRRKLMADQIKLRRQQKKKKEESEHQAEEQMFLKSLAALNPFALCPPQSLAELQIDEAVATPTEAQERGFGPPPRCDDKYKMAFSTGTYVLRISDQDLDVNGEPSRNRLHVWRVDNHLLLQKYERIEEVDDKKYKKTCRYVGYQCEEGWKFIELRVEPETQEEEEIVLEAYPTKEEIEEGQNRCNAKEV